MTKFFTKAALAATVATGLFAAPAFAAPAGNKNFTARATIVKPVTIANTTDLNFGTVVLGTNLVSATVTVAKNDSITCTANVTCGTTGSSADFTLTGGVANQTVQITYNAPPSVLTHTNTTSTVGFTLDPSQDVVLDGSGAGSFSIGGTITVATATVDGNYSAIVNVVANYL